VKGGYAQRARTDRVRPPRGLVRASGRLLDFSVRGHMLGGSTLTRGQRVGAVVLLVLFIVAAPMFVFVLSMSAGDRVWYTGLMCTYLGAILDPQVFRLRLGTPPNFSAIPPVCLLLIAGGMTLAAVGFIMRHLL
jgi:hypothetical protein